jgi:hypothetical protein
MERLLDLPLDNAQEQVVLQSLREAGIPFRETRLISNFLGGGAIWVTDENFPRASALINADLNAFALTGRAAWRAAWTTEYNRSYAQWLWARFRRKPISMALRLLALTAIVWLFVIWPITYLLASAR